jgi:hypothetical protein
MFKTNSKRRRFLKWQARVNRHVSLETFQRYEAYVIRCSDNGGYPIELKDWLEWGNTADD